MKKIFFLLSIILISCSKSISVEGDIEKVVNCVAFELNHNFYKNLPLLDTLSKITISTSDSSFSPHSGNIKIKRLMDYKINNKKIFNSQDSLFFLKQNDRIKEYHLTNKKYGNLLTVNSSKYPTSKLYFMTIPIFSCNRKYAYVISTLSIPKISGSADSYLLEKINGKWKIIKIEEVWIS